MPKAQGILGGWTFEAFFEIDAGELMRAIVKAKFGGRMLRLDCELGAMEGRRMRDWLAQRSEEPAQVAVVTGSIQDALQLGGSLPI
jgi:hypothetical protein